LLVLLLDFLLSKRLSALARQRKNTLVFSCACFFFFTMSVDVMLLPPLGASNNAIAVGGGVAVLILIFALLPLSIASLVAIASPLWVGWILWLVHRTGGISLPIVLGAAVSGFLL